MTIDYSTSTDKRRTGRIIRRMTPQGIQDYQRKEQKKEGSQNSTEIIWRNSYQSPAYQQNS